MPGTWRDDLRAVALRQAAGGDQQLARVASASASSRSTRSDSSLAGPMKPQVLTISTSARAGRPSRPRSPSPAAGRPSTRSRRCSWRSPGRRRGIEACPSQPPADCVPVGGAGCVAVTWGVAVGVGVIRPPSGPDAEHGFLELAHQAGVLPLEEGAHAAAVAGDDLDRPLRLILEELARCRPPGVLFGPIDQDPKPRPTLDDQLDVDPTEGGKDRRGCQRGGRASARAPPAERALPANGASGVGLGVSSAVGSASETPPASSSVRARKPAIIRPTPHTRTAMTARTTTRRDQQVRRDPARTSDRDGRGFRVRPEPPDASAPPTPTGDAEARRRTGAGERRG